MSQDTMDSYDDGIMDAIGILEKCGVRADIIESVRSLLNRQQVPHHGLGRAGLPPLTYGPCIDCGQPTVGSSNGPLCNCYWEGNRKVVVPARPRPDPILPTTCLYETCPGLCKCGDGCALDARHYPSSGCRCELLGCPDES